MTRWAVLVSGLAALAVVLAPAFLGGGRAMALSTHPTRVVLETTDDGYGCVEGCDSVDFSAGAWEPGIDVPLGAVVELGFRWAHQAYPYEEHIFLLEGYRLESDKIDSQNREAWIRFVADQPGPFTFKCDFHCELHDWMQRAKLRVNRAGAGPAVAVGPSYTPTKISLTTSSQIITGLDPVVVGATLTDDEGQPVAKAELRFFTEAEFAGVRELVHIGTAVTNAEGVARTQFRALSDDPEQRVLVRFAGLGLYDGAEEELALTVTGSPRSAYTPAGTGFEDVRGLARIGVVLTFGALWATFAFVLIQALRIARAVRTAPVPGAGALPGRRTSGNNGSISREGRDA